MSRSDPLILTLKFDPDTFDRLDGLRRDHFPPERNVVPAHVTLFHALPGEREPDIHAALAALSVEIPPVPLRFPKVRFLGKGVALEVESAELVRLRRKLADEWAAWLTPQDRQGYRPHVTVQNKVTAAAARRLYDHLSAGWDAIEGVGEGLLLWHYRGGPWELAGEFPFAEV